MDDWYTLTGEINPGVIGKTIVDLQARLYNAGNVPVSKLVFFISSLGGDADSAIRLYDYLRSLPFPVHTVGFGQVYSAGLTIFLAGEERIALRKTKFLVHEGVYTIGQPTAPMHLHEENLSILKELGKRNKDIISERSGKAIGEVENLMKDVKIISAEQARTIGIVTSITDRLPTGPVIPVAPQSAGSQTA